MKRKIIFLSASPRNDGKTASGAYLELLGRQFGEEEAEIETINVRESFRSGHTQADFQALHGADAIVIAFPLYFFCMPGLLTRFLDEYFKYYLQRAKPLQDRRIYAIVNCGFPEPEINEEAARVVESFSRQVGAEYRFSILIGGGGLVLGAKDAPFMRKTLEALGQAMESLKRDALGGGEPRENCLIAPNFPRRLYYFMADKGFTRTAAKNGLTKKQIRRRTYRPGEQELFLPFRLSIR